MADAMGSRVEVSEAHDGKVARIVLNAPPGNALDLVMVEELQRALEAIARWPALTAVVIEGAGSNFSTGSSSTQLRPPFAAALIEGFHAAIRSLLGLDALIVSLVRGQCQGAGVTLALAADIVVADKTTRISLIDMTGSSPPLTTLLLAERLDRSRAAQALLSGKTYTGEEAAVLQLVSDYAGGWESAAVMVDRHLKQLALAGSSSGMRDVTRALRSRLLSRIAEALPELERALIEQLGKRVAGEPDARTTMPPKWKPA